MKSVRNLLDGFNGMRYRQEYLCLALENFSPSLHIYLVMKGKVASNISAHHCFVGYCPVIFALPGSYFQHDRIHLVFSDAFLTVNEIFQKKDVLGELFMEKIHVESTSDGDIVFYRATYGKHQFLPAFNQFVLSLSNALYNKKEGNVFLKGNILKQVQIAYAMPRKICLISVGRVGLYNLFPTDLHGKVNDQLYLISLRHEGKACRQVMEAGKIVLSDMEAEAFKKVYNLGKNHMQPLKERNAFDFSQIDSQQFHLPLPNHAIAYKELELRSSFTEGIHRLLVFRINNEVRLTDNPETLAHIHSVYASWRENNRLRGNYLLR